MRIAALALALCLAHGAVWAASSDHPTLLSSPLPTWPPAQSSAGGMIPAYATCPTFGDTLSQWKVYLSSVGPNDPGSLVATIPFPAGASYTWTCATPLPNGTYYLTLTLVDSLGVEGARNAAFPFIIGAAPTTFPLTLVTSGAGSGTVGGQGDYAAGAEVTITALPDGNSTLVDITPAPCAVTFPMPAAPLVCTIDFALKPPPPVIGVGSPIFVSTAVGVVLNVRSTPGGTIVGTQPHGATGIITGGPTVISGVTWWQIAYTNAPSGWSSGTYLSLTAP